MRSVCWRKLPATQRFNLDMLISMPAYRGSGVPAFLFDTCFIFLIERKIV
jgi:hypothetical protein